MITWRSSLALCAALAACGEGGGPGFLSGGGLNRAAEPLTEARLAQGAILVRPPAGYCVDPRGLRPRFAAMARCDTLGGEAPGADLPLALMTVSLSAGAEALDAAALGSAEAGGVLERQESELITLIRAQAPPLQDGFAGTFWRGTGTVGDFTVGLALYAPEGGRAAEAAGASLLTGVMSGLRSTRPAAPPAPAQTETQASDTSQPQENPVGAWISGLFN